MTDSFMLLREMATPFFKLPLTDKRECSVAVMPVSQTGPERKHASITQRESPLIDAERYMSAIPPIIWCENSRTLKIRKMSFKQRPEKYFRASRLRIFT